MYSNLIQSSNYVTKRQSIKLLGEILLDRSNYNVMNKYISNEDNLKIMMNLLKDKSKNIQFEAFHVFKVTLISFFSPPVSNYYSSSLISTCTWYKGLRSQPAQATSHWGNPKKEQGETDRVSTQLS